MSHGEYQIRCAADARATDARVRNCTLCSMLLALLLYALMRLPRDTQDHTSDPDVLLAVAQVNAGRSNVVGRVHGD